MKQKKNRLSFSLAMPKGYNRTIHAMILILNFFGVLMIVSSNMTMDTTALVLLEEGAKEVLFVIISYIIMVFMARNFSMARFKKYYFPILIGLLVLLGWTLVFPAVNGAKAWIRLGVMTLQPSELAKVFIIVMIAFWVGDRKPRKNQTTLDILGHPLAILFLIVGFVTIFQRDLGSALVILGIAYICLLIPVNKRLSRMQNIMMILMIVGLFGLVFISTEPGIALIEKIFTTFNLEPYMLERFRMSANPFLDRYGSGYQIFNGLVAFASGGLWGVGYGNGFIKYSYLPYAQTDFILAIIVEEFGIFGFLMIFIPYMVIAWQMIRASLYVRKEQDKVILIGTVAYLLIHFILNVGGITAFIPLTGVPLLFISSGGSSRLAIMMLMGIAQSVLARNKREDVQIERERRRRKRT